MKNRRIQGTQSPVRPKINLTFWIFAGLIILNVSVFASHGDPRHLFADTAKAAEPTEYPASEVADSIQPSVAPTRVELADSQELVGPPAPLLLAALSPGLDSGTPKIEPLTPVLVEADKKEATEKTLAVVPALAPTPGATSAALARLLKTYEPTAGVSVDSAMKTVDRFELKSGQNPFEAIVARGVGRDDVNQAFASMDGLVDFRYFRPGDRFTVYLGSEGELRGVDIYQRVTQQYKARRMDDEWVAERIEVQESTSVEAISGDIEVSLWNALVGNGERAALVTLFVDIFAWDVDFFSDVHPGDTFRILVEKRHADGEFIGYGNILAAEFGRGDDVHQAFIHENAEGLASYFDESGSSMRKQLLKAPVKYANVTSGFGKRRHPILGYTRSHNGVDYGVPRGTPIWTVGDGKVVRAGRNGGYGNFISIRHSNGWVSQYAHLDKILVKTGQRVSQKETIGRVGSTGMSTGPHLHYELKYNGRYVNPATQRFARGKSLSGPELEAFKKTLPKLRERMNAMQVAEGKPSLPKREG